MRVEPYAAIGDVSFGSTQVMVTEVLGKPEQIARSRDGEIELSYPHLTARFANDKLVEVSADAKTISLGSVVVQFEKLRDFLQQNDDSVFDCIGFLVSPKYGIAFDPEFPSWVTAFPKERLLVWQQIARR